MDDDVLTQTTILVEFLELYFADRERGEARELSEYAARFPGHEDSIAREFARLEGDAARAQDASSWSDLESGKSRLPGYRVVRELGYGGQGTVVLAEDIELKRLVALKVLRSALGSPSEARLARLRREVSILARLDHPGICAVYRAHLDNDPPFVAMRYVSGPTLSKLVARARASSAPDAKDATERDADARASVPCVPKDRAELDRLLAFFEAAARALHAAHEAGVVHRDVKPPNIVVQDGARPVLLDFGLARTQDADASLVTRTGELFGTPPYMSPEQIDGQDEALDRRTDVYSLGVTLFECATGRRPFEAPSQHRLEQAIRLEPVPRASRTNPALPRDLDVVLETAMEKERTRRYATALDLAEELRRVRERHPVLARPAGVVLRARRWSQRNPAIATALVLLAAGAVSLSTALVWLLAALNEAGSRNSAMEASRLLAVDPLQAMKKALQSHELAPGFDSRSALYAALIEQRVERVLPPTDLFLTALSRDRRTYAASRKDGTIARFALPGGTPERLGRVAAKATSIDLSFDGSRVAVGCEDGTVALFRTGAPEQARVLRAHAGAIRAVAFTPDAARFASSSDDGIVRVHEFERGAEAFSFAAATGPVGGLRYAPNGRWLVSWLRLAERESEPPYFELFVWDAECGAPVTALRGHTKRTSEVRFASDGELAASVSDDETVRLWELPSGDCRWTRRHPAKVHDVAFSPDGTRIATACDPGEPGISEASGASVFDVADGRHRFDLCGHLARAVHSIDWSADGRALLTASYDGSARVWDAHDGRPISSLRTDKRLHDARFLPGCDSVIVRQDFLALIAHAREAIGSFRPIRHEAPVTHAAFSPDSRLVATCDKIGVVLVHDVRTGERRARFVADTERLTRVAFCRDGAGLVVGSSDGTCVIYDVERRERRGAFDVGSGPIAGLCVLADGARALAASGAELCSFDLASGRRLQRFRGSDHVVQCFDVSQGEKYVAAGDAFRTVRVWELDTATRAREWKDWSAENKSDPEDGIFVVSFHPAGDELLTMGGDGYPRRYRVSSGELLWTSETRYRRFGAAHWLDGGEQVALMAKWSGPTTLFTQPDVGMKEHVDLQPEPAGRPMAMDVSPDETLLLTSATDGRTQLWSLRDHAPWAIVDGHDGAITFAAFSPDGTCFVTTSADGTARIWPTDPEAAARANEPLQVDVPAAGSR